MNFLGVKMNIKTMKLNKVHRKDLYFIDTALYERYTTEEGVVWMSKGNVIDPTKMEELEQELKTAK